MKHPSMWQEVLMSIPSRVAFQSLAALILIRLVYRPHYFNWLFVLCISIAYGVVATFIVQLYLEKYARSLGLSSPWQLRNLVDAVKNTEVPTDKTTRNALPAYLERRMRAIEKQRKSSTFAYVLFGFMFIVSVATRNAFEVITFGVVLGFSVYAYRYRKKTENSIRALQQSLDEQGIRPSDEARVKSVRWSKDVLRVQRSIWLIGAILLVLAIAVVFSARERNAGKNAAPPIGGVDPASSSLQTAPFTSSKYGFIINFPGKPSGNDYSYQPNCNEDPIPYTLYSSSLAGNTQIIDLYVYAWPKHDGDFTAMPQSSLGSALINFLNSDLITYGATLVGKIYEKRIPSNGALAEEGQFAEKVTGGTVTGYVRVFTVGNFRYDIVSQGIGKAAFEQLADSFQGTSPGSTTTSDGPSGQTDVACLNESTLSVQ